MDHSFDSLQQDSALDRAASDYDRDGVIRARGLLSSDDIASVRAALARYYRQIAPSLPPADVVFEADGVAVRNLWRMEHHDPFFADLGRRPEIRRMVSRLVHGEPILLGVETFNKPARVGSGVPAHQDNAYFCQSPPDILTIWISIDGATDANGTIFYIRGSHATGMLAHQPSALTGNSATDFQPSSVAMTQSTLPRKITSASLSAALRPSQRRTELIMGILASV